MCPHLRIEGNLVEEISVFDDYYDAKAKAVFLGKDISNKIKIEGDVDTSKTGSYQVDYILNYGMFYIKRTKTIKVIDTTEPTIELLGDENIMVCGVDNYIEPGYIAMDNYDGDITDKVEAKAFNDHIAYSVADTSGNIFEITRNIVIGDEEKPIISLIGNQNIYLPIGSTYLEKGVSAKDNCDGDISNLVTTSGTVDTNTTGHYRITYSIKDSRENANSIMRDIYVYDSNGGGGVIYLTFDDGPSGYTNHILDILAKYNAPATFFVTGVGSDSIIERAYNEGHTIALHTYTHQWNIYSSVDAYFNDLQNIQDRVERITGVKSYFIRFPGGSSNTVSRNYKSGIMSTLASEVQSRGFTYFDWNVCVEDAGACAKSGVTDKNSCVIGYFKRGLSSSRPNIVLLHDTKAYTAYSLETMIQYALANGYHFEKITEDTVPVHSAINN